MKKKIFRNLVACAMAVCVFAGTLFTQKVSAAGPTDTQKASATPVTMTLVEEATTEGTAYGEVVSTYYKIKLKRPYNIKVYLASETDMTQSVTLQVWNNKDLLLKGSNTTQELWKYDSESGLYKNEFKVEELRKGTYYIEVREKGSLSGWDYTLKVVPEMIEKVKNVRVSYTAGSKKATVRWKPLKGEAVSGYMVYRRTGKKGKYKLVETVWNVKSKSAKVKVTPGKTYYFKVRAFYFSKVSDKNFYAKYSSAVKLKAAKK